MINGASDTAWFDNLQFLSGHLGIISCIMVLVSAIIYNRLNMHQAMHQNYSLQQNLDAA